MIHFYVDVKQNHLLLFIQHWAVGECIPFHCFNRRWQMNIFQTCTVVKCPIAYFFYTFWNINNSKSDTARKSIGVDVFHW